MPLYVATPGAGDAADPDRLLARFDVTVAELQERVLTPAQSAARSVHPLAPKGFAGQTRHAMAVSALGELVIPRGWKRNDDGNVARVVHVERRLAVVVATGNALTGMPFAFTGRSPSTKWPKGNLTRAAAADNQQLAFFDVGLGDVDDGEQGKTPPLETWLLLLRAVPEEVRAELSRPLHVNAAGFVDAWGKPRIIIPPVPNDGSAIDPEAGDEGDVPDVPVDLL